MEKENLTKLLGKVASSKYEKLSDKEFKELYDIVNKEYNERAIQRVLKFVEPGKTPKGFSKDLYSEFNRFKLSIRNRNVSNKSITYLMSMNGELYLHINSRSFDDDIYIKIKDDGSLKLEVVGITTVESPEFPAITDLIQVGHLIGKKVWVKELIVFQIGWMVHLYTRETNKILLIDYADLEKKTKEFIASLYARGER